MKIQIKNDADLDRTESFGEQIVAHDPYALRLVTVVEAFAVAVAGSIIVIALGGGWLS